MRKTELLYRFRRRCLEPWWRAGRGRSSSDVKLARWFTDRFPSRWSVLCVCEMCSCSNHPEALSLDIPPKKEKLCEQLIDDQPHCPCCPCWSFRVVPLSNLAWRHLTQPLTLSLDPMTFELWDQGDQDQLLTRGRLPLATDSQVRSGPEQGSVLRGNFIPPAFLSLCSAAEPFTSGVFPL